VNPATTFWSLVVARFTSICVLLVLMRLQRKPLLPGMTVAPLVVLAGILDAIGQPGLRIHALVESGRVRLVTNVHIHALYDTDEGIAIVGVELHEFT
jgi:hypothetical protein